MDEKYAYSLVAAAYKEAVKNTLKNASKETKDAFIQELSHQLKTIKMPEDHDKLDDLMPSMLKNTL